MHRFVRFFLRQVVVFIATYLIILTDVSKTIVPTNPRQASYLNGTATTPVESSWTLPELLTLPTSQPFFGWDPHFRPAVTVRTLRTKAAYIPDPFGIPMVNMEELNMTEGATVMFNSLRTNLTSDDYINIQDLQTEALTTTMATASTTTASSTTSATTTPRSTLRMITRNPFYPFNPFLNRTIFDIRDL